MTREEIKKARDLLKMIEVKEPMELIVKSWWGSFAKDYKEALQMAIKVLEKELDEAVEVDPVIKVLEQQSNIDAVSQKIDEFELNGKTAEVWIVKGKLQIRCLGVIHNISLSSVIPQLCIDCISREAVLEVLKKNRYRFNISQEGYCEGKVLWSENLIKDDVCKEIEQLPSVTPKEKIGYCKDCKWWKDNDGIFRRGIDAESQCPMNRIEVYEGNGYCFMFEPQESMVSE